MKYSEEPYDNQPCLELLEVETTYHSPRRQSNIIEIGQIRKRQPNSPLIVVNPGLVFWFPGQGQLH